MGGGIPDELPHGDDPTPRPGSVDMRPAENWVLRPELIKICQDAMLKLTPRDLSFPYNPRGFPNALVALSTFFNKHFEPVVAVEPSHLVTGAGAGGCLVALLSTICKPGEGILIPCPYWNGFDFLCANSQVKSIPVLVSDDLHGSLATDPVPALSKALANSTVKVTAAIFTNPHNPLGRSSNPSFLAACLKFCEENDIHYISDEVYALTRFPSQDLPVSPPFRSILSFDLTALGVHQSRVHAIWSTSKDLGQSGMRFGCVITQSNTGLPQKIAVLLANSVSSLSSRVTCEVLESKQLPALLNLNANRLNQAYEAITSFFRYRNIEYYSCDSGPYICANIAPHAKTSDDADVMVRKFQVAGVYIFPLHAFHPPSSAKGWGRLNFAIDPKELDIAIKRLSDIWPSTTLAT